jgi:hypothetical protein
MDAAEFFNGVVKGNYEEFIRQPSSRRLLWNATVSMNTVAEYVALDRLGYNQISRKELDETAKQIREDQPILADLKYCAETFKHVRKIKDHPSLTAPFTTIATSTGVSEHDMTAWKINQHDLVQVLDKAFNALNALPELK